MASLVKFRNTTESHLGGSSIKCSTKEALLGVLTSSELHFHEHISLICSKARRRLNTLDRIANFVSYLKRHWLWKLHSQFNYCPLIWRFHSQALNNKINHLQEIVLRIAAYSDYKSSLNELLQKDNSFTIHHRNIQSLSIKIYKFLN